jgi:predicted phage terminase large subunit-like protein
MVKLDWFKRYSEAELPPKFDQVFQSWDTANKPTELSDYSVCTTWGIKNNRLYLLHVLRKRLDYPTLRRAVQEQAQLFEPKKVIIEDRASGTQLIQDLLNERLHFVQRYQTSMDKIMRMHSVSNTIENGFVYLPEKAAWLTDYLHELSTFPNSKFDDQADSTSQALDWYKQQSAYPYHGVVEFWRQEVERMKAAKQPRQPCRNLTY